MSVVLFCGPSLPPRAASVLLEGVDAQVFGPVSQGDVYRAARSRPRAIGIIDGYFARMPAVWHKEILWTLSEGIHVLGASSMGALRAAELAAFGMVGVGRIFEAFHSGELEDDDEVTLIHGPEDADYMPLSEALVDIRATVAHATEQGILDSPTAKALIQRAKATYYPERSYRGLITALRGADADTRERLDALEAWLPAHRVEQKRIDAEALVAELRRLETEAVQEKRVDFRFERTDAWVQVTRHHAPSAAPGGHLEEPTSSSLEAILDELRLLGGDELRTALRGALGRHLARQRARGEGVTGASPELFGEAVNRFFWERGVLDPAEIEAWILSRDLDLKRFTSFMQDQAQAYWTSVIVDTEARAELTDYLRTTDDYERVVRRAMRKRAALAERSLPAEGGDEDELLRWFYVRQRGENAPPADLAAAAVRAGFRDEDALLGALRRERAFVEESPGS